MLEIFKQLDVPDDKLHNKFIVLRDVLKFSGEQEILNEWVKGFDDRDGKIVKEFQTSFHSSFWEFYLFSVFKECGFAIDFSKNRPDFIISKPHEIYVEAVVSEIKQNGRKEEERNLDDILSMVEPHVGGKEFNEFLNEAIVRYSNSIHSKKKKYVNEYLHLDWIKKEVPFVIALASYSQVNYGKEFHYPLMALLYGYYFNPLANSYDKLSEVTKPGTTSRIPIGLFGTEEMREVSAVIFSCTLTLGKLTALSKSQETNSLDLNYVLNIRHDYDEPNFKLQEVSTDSPEELSDGLFIFHNPNAKNKLSLDVFKGSNAVQVYVEGNAIKFEGENLPIVARLNISKFLLPNIIKEQFLSDVFHKFNPNFKISVFQVLEIDFSVNPKEITLFDKETQKPVVVDLSKENIESLKNKAINENDIVYATLKKQLNGFGDTVAWFLISIEKIT